MKGGPRGGWGRLAEEAFAGIRGDGRDVPCARSRRAANDGLAYRPRQREPAAQRLTLRATISQRRWPRPLRPKQWRVLGFQDGRCRIPRKFAHDSSLEQRGFELPVPRAVKERCRNDKV